MKATRILTSIFLTILISCTVGSLLAAQAQGPSAASSQPALKAAATYTSGTRGTLALELPYSLPHAGSGKLTIEVLSPEDHILAHLERTVEVSKGEGLWHQKLILDRPEPVDEIVWERLQYEFTYDGAPSPATHAITSLSLILRRPVVRILAQKSYLTGSAAAIRIVVTDSQNELIPGGGSVKVELLNKESKPVQLFNGRLNHRGTTEAQFHFPANLAGSYQLHFVAETPIGSTEYTQSIALEDKASILLTTEKPLYQPGQTIHIRALALDRANHHAVSGEKLVFEVEDSRGNKVFKKLTTTDAYGIASTEFTLADEVNLGAYHLRALMGQVNGEPTNKAEITLNVERYVLPKFKVAVEFASKDGKPKKDYRPGDHVIGTVHANYFFGKPVDGAEIDLKASTMDVEIVEASSDQGKTDKDGIYHFDLKLPSYFAGRPISAGAARALVEASVKDSAGHTETRGEAITVSQSPLLITAIPEGGTLVPGLDNQVFLLTSYPDGTPARTTLTVHHKGSSDQQLSTDASGVTVFHLAAGDGMESLKVEADDHQGSRATQDLRLDSRTGEDHILLRTERAIYRTGDRVALKLLSTRQRGTGYIDIVKDGQTILTRDLDIEGGQAELSMTASPSMSGTLDVNAYFFGRDAQPVGDHRLLFIQPADELKIDASTDAALYKPGDDARIRFHVTDAHGEGVSAAVGVQIVDEAVFALAEKQPGFAKVFFYLGQEVMKPRFEIHSLTMSDVIRPTILHAAPEPADPDMAARALFSATEIAHTENIDAEYGREVPQGRFPDYYQRYLVTFNRQVNTLAAQLDAQISGKNSKHDLLAIFEQLASKNGAAWRDPWGTPLRMERTSFWLQGRNKYYLVRSAGPNQQFNDADDLALTIEDRSGSMQNTTPAKSASFNQGEINLRIEHEVGPFTRNAEVDGTVTDQTGACIPTAAIALRNLATGAVLTAQANQNGAFTFSAIPAGKYTVTISAVGFMQSQRENIFVEQRDRAHLSATLTVGAVTEAVDVETMTVNSAVVTVAEASVDARGGAVMGAIGNGAGRGFHGGFPAAAPQMMREREVGDLAINGRFQFKQRLAAPEAEAKAPAAAAHVRSYFPEALYINPEILTDGHGDATITIPVADSITTWRMAMLASTPSGALGTGTSSLKVFQDFFVDLDLPVTLTQGDRVTLPVAIYNYAGQAGKVRLKLEPEDWFSLVDDTEDKQIEVSAGQVGSSRFTVEAKRIGKFKLTLSAQMPGTADEPERKDIVVREIEVIPNGRQQSIVFNGRLESPGPGAKHALNFPQASIPAASTVFVRLYPGPLSQIIEGMDSILRMPGGCFEQTSSSTYPNVLALDYMKRTKKLTPEVHAKAEGYIANGYQRLLTFEVPGGGFSWFGEAPANKILTAYGLMEFSDMARVSEVDPRLIERTRDWLAQQQQPDGSWKPDTSFINEGATNRYNSDVLRITAYIAWALANTGYQGPGIDKAKQYIERHIDDTSAKIDTYTVAVIANFAVDFGKDKEFTNHAMQLLLDARTEGARSEREEQVWWSAEETSVYATGASAAVETTSLAAQALLKWGQSSATARKALNFIASKKDATGAWGSTQATILALRALLLAAQMSASDVHGAVQIVLNGKTVETLQLTPENSDLLHQFVFKDIQASQSNDVQIRFDGNGGLAYQVVGQYYLPWETKPAEEALSIDVKYDRSKLAQDDTATATATVTNHLTKTANMIMIDLGIPPGFDLQSEDLQQFLESSAKAKVGRLEKFSLTATQAILYFNSLAPKQTIRLKFRLRAKYPIRAKTFESRVYEYYDPEVSAIARPTQLEVAPKGSN